MANFAKLAATAKRLIEKNGRTVTLKKRGQAVADPTHPWRGADEAGVVSVDVKAVILDYVLTPDTSDFVKRGLKRALVAALSATEDLRDFTIMTDGAETWELLECKTLAPADTRLLYEFQVRK